MNKSATKLLTALAVTMTLGISMNAMGSTTRWEEEVSSLDGSKLIVERSQTTDFFGQREIGQSAPRTVETLSFVLPGTGQTVTWKSNFGGALQDNLTLRYVGLLGGVPYIVTYPVRCHAYNKWGRPNPPYVFFKFDGKAWVRISNEEFPREVMQANVILDGYNENKSKLTAEERKASHLSAATIQRLNMSIGGDAVQYLHQLIREPVTTGPAMGTVNCPKMVFYKGGWVGPGEFGRRFMDTIGK